MLRTSNSLIAGLLTLLTLFLMGGGKQSSCTETEAVGIFAHRGCSYEFPEHTLDAFREACACSGLRGIELDIQFSKDKKIVAIHDETVDRTTDGTGYVCDFTLDELRNLRIDAGQSTYTRIPTIEEVLGLCSPYCKNNGMLINIELKNSNIRYEGLEASILSIVKEFGLGDYVIYSSFNPDSIALIKKLDPSAKTAILATFMSSCLSFASCNDVDALHPYVEGLDIDDLESKTALPVRVFGSEPIFPSKESFEKKFDFDNFLSSLKLYFLCF